MDNYNFLGASLAIGIACLGVAIGQAFLIFKTMDTVGKNPHLSTFFLTMTILGIALLESAAIYGLVISLQVLSANFSDPISAIGVGLAIGLTGFGAGVGEGLLLSNTVNAINLNPEYKNKIMAFMILFVALIESSAIYGFIIAWQILGNSNINGYLSIGAGLAIGIVGIGVPIGEGILASKSILGIGEKITAYKILITFTVLGIALIESAAIYGLVIAMQILSKDASLGVGAIGAGLAIGLAGFGASLGEGNLLSKIPLEIAKKPTKAKLYIPMGVLGVALVETAAIYGLVVAIQILSKGTNLGVGAIGAGLAIGLAGLGVSLGEGILTGKAMTTIAIERVNTSKIMTNMILFLALVESAAIYGIVISFSIINAESINPISAIGAGVAIGLAGFGVGLGEGIMSSRSIFIIGKRPRFASFFLTITILGTALVESAAIYALVIAYKIVSSSDLNGLASLGAGIAIGLTALGAGFAEGYLASGCLKAMARNPENRTKDLTFMVLFVALVEVLAIYGMFIAFDIINK